MYKHIPHLFLNEIELKEEILTDENFHHFVNVLRLKEQDFFYSFDNLGNKFKSEILKIEKKKLCFKNTFLEKKKPSEIKITLIQALLKIDTFEEVIDKSTQLGVDKIIPIITDNISVNIELFKKKHERFEKILKSSSEQSQRFFLPKLNKVENLDFISTVTNIDNTFIAYEKAEIPFRNLLNQYSNKEITIFIGPEGGFSENEIELFLGKNFKLISLSKNILRAETAVISALSNINYQLF